jgi:hypothetical protein
MKQVPVVTYLDSADAQALALIANRLGISVAAAVRMCVRYVLHEAVAFTPLTQIARKAGEKEGEGHAGSQED